MRDGIRKELSKTQLAFSKRIFELSHLKDNRELSGEAMHQLSIWRTSGHDILNLIETMECNEKESE